MWAALVDTPRLHQEIVGVWGKDVFGIDMSAIRPTAVNTWCKSRIRPPQLVTSPECWAVLDYAVLQSPHVRGDAAWEIRDDRTAHGIGVWFDWEGAQAVAFSNSPLSSERHIFGQAFFPWPEPLDLCRGDEVRVSCVRTQSGRNMSTGGRLSSAASTAERRPRSISRTFSEP